MSDFTSFGWGIAVGTWLCYLTLRISDRRQRPQQVGPTVTVPTGCYCEHVVENTGSSFRITRNWCPGCDVHVEPASEVTEVSW